MTTNNTTPPNIWITTSGTTTNYNNITIGTTASSSGFIPNANGWIYWNPTPEELSSKKSENSEQSKQAKVQQGNIEGYECISCKEFSPMAELNLPLDNEEKYEFACYSCRNGLK